MSAENSGAFRKTLMRTFRLLRYDASDVMISNMDCRQKKTNEEVVKSIMVFSIFWARQQKPYQKLLLVKSSTKQFI